MKKILFAIVITPLAFAGALTSGSMSSARYGSVVTESYSVSLSGTSNSGNPFSIAIGRPGFAPNLGNDRCPNAGGSSVPVNCTWDFSNINTMVASDGFFASANQSVVWDGITYDLSPGTPYTLRLVLTVTTNSITDASTVGSSHTWGFGTSAAGIDIAVTLLQGNTTLVSETISGSANISGSAFQSSVVGSLWGSEIQYNVVPEPGSWITSAFGFGLILFGLRSRTRNRKP